MLTTFLQQYTAEVAVVLPAEVTDCRTSRNVDVTGAWYAFPTMDLISRNEKRHDDSAISDEGKHAYPN